MRVFVTGASGFIGTATIRELLAHNHAVLGLARSPASAQKLTAIGVEVHDGSIEDLASLKSGAAQCDGVIHLGFSLDFADFAGSCAKDRAAIEAMGSVLVETGKPLIITSGILMLDQGKVGTEDDMHATTGFAALRGANEDLVLGLAKENVRAMVMRLPPTVHGESDKGFIPMIIAGARKAGEATYIGDGMNRWTAVHRLDAARLYRLALEKGKAGRMYHAVAEESLFAKDIAGAVGRGLNVPVVSKSSEQATAELGFVALAFSSDVPATSVKTREELGWESTHPGLLSDIENVYLK